MTKESRRLFNFEITEELRKLIKKEAYEKDVSASQAVREILESYFNLNERKQRNS